jgi:hypothetical protein
MSGFIQNLGGRSSELNSFVSKIKAGASAQEAYQAILEKTVVDLCKASVIEEKDHWTIAQFWLVATKLAKDVIDFEEILLHPGSVLYLTNI